MVDSYADYGEDKQPVVLIYPGYLDLRLFDILYENKATYEEINDKEKVLLLLNEGPKPVKFSLYDLKTIEKGDEWWEKIGINTQQSF